MSKYRLMTHMVAYYPDKESSFAVARALADGGAAYIELQFPFSDPAADGPVIQEACEGALRSGFSLKGGFELAQRISSYSRSPLFIMTYANPLVSLGVGEFVDRALEAGAAGLIVPDLVPGDDEGLYAAGAKAGLPIVPVVVPSISPDRLKEIKELESPYLYTALRSGITGRQTDIADETFDFLRECSRGGTKVFGGFGIRTVEQIKGLTPYVHAPVVGSALVQVIAQSCDGNADDLYRAVCDVTRLLCGE